MLRGVTGNLEFTDVSMEYSTLSSRIGKKKSTFQSITGDEGPEG
jgi:hypothetical protein